MRVAVVGGGISGLAAAYELARRLPDAAVVVLEGSPRVGGKLLTGTVAGVEVDLGAEAMLARRPEAVGLARAVGLGERLIAPTTTAAQVRAGGSLHPLPARTLFGIPADLVAVRASGVLSEAAMARIEAELNAAPVAPLGGDIPVGALVRDRLGDEVVDRLVEPLLGGVYAGRSDELSLQATMPALAARLMRDGGSLVAAAQALTDVGTYDPSAGPVFASIGGGGMGVLPRVLAASGGFEVRTGMTVRGLRRTATGFALTCGPAPEPELVEADAVVLAVPAPKAALLLAEVAPAASTDLGGVETASMAVVTLAFDGVVPPPGSGLLIGTREGFAVKAVTLSSQKWPLDTGGLVLLRASVGRAGETEILQRPDEDLIALVRRDLRALTGVGAVPVDAVVTRWGGGLPQYGVGHVERIARVRAAVAQVPGLSVCGAAFDGVGIPACIGAAYAAVDRVVEHLSAGHPVGER